ncbi:prealbumin-like fold domain-containing protein, partial [Ruminococcus sp. FC2018]|uniref:SpaA isopeptide-forming pilin-related protein n=1 Tax=Ruminococcus sp. FC2018 TaxID=1410617 RepID=UPI00055EF381
MKKRSLFKRLLSGFVATAMALSICFSDKVFEDLFASAAEGDPSVTVKVMNDGNLEKYANHVSGTKYYVLGALVNKEDAGISVKKDNVDKIVAWDCKEIDLANKAEDTVTFEKFYKKSDNYASEFDRDQAPEPYDKNAYAFIYRVFQYRVEGNNGVNPYATKGVEPTNLIAPQGQRPAGWNYQAYNEISSDQFDGYVWEPATVSGDSYTSILDKRNPELYVTVNFGKPTTVTADDHVYAVVEVEHVGAPAKTIGYAPLVTDGEGKMTATVAIQAGEKQDWYQENGDHSTEKFTGNEPNYKVRLFQAEKATGIKDILGGKATEYKVGDMVLGQEFLSTDKSKDEAEIAKPKYYAIATLGTVSDPDNYTYSEILGPARVFGITADRFEQINHMQTNFAANVYKQAEFRPDLSKPTGGSIYVGKLVTFDATDKTKYTEVDTPYIRFEKINQVTQHPEGYGAKLFSPYGDKVDITADGMEYVERHEMSADDIKNKVVGPAISHIQFMSDVLAKQEANYIPVKGESSYSIDTTHYPENTTIYVDADSMLNDKGEMPKLHMSLAKGQNIVFNFKNADKVKVGQFYIRTLVDGVWNVGPEPKTDDGFYAGHTGESQKWDSDFNNWINEYVMRNVVFNFNKATDVEVGGTAGLFIVKNPNSETVMKGTTTGWMATAGYFQKSDGEWHFPYDDVGDYKEPVPADFVISKTSITNNKEIEGATIQIIDAERPQGDWDYMVELNKEQGVEAVIEGGKTIGITWTSSGTAKNIKLSNGNYTFRETGDEFTSKTDGKKYKVVTSETNFVVASGKVVKEPKDVTEDNGTIKYTKTNNTITISDAQAGGPVTYPVHISKTDITGQKAVAGATLTVYTDTENTADRVEVAHYDSRAVEGSKGTFMLEAGKYVLVEKATVDGRAPSENGKTYKVITTEFKFEVKQNGTVECTGAKASVDNFTKDEKANGGLVLTKLADKNEPYFIMCDAANTTNITVDKQAVTGEHTIKNARLWLTDSTGSAVPGADIITTGNAKTDAFTVALEDGEYTIHEEAAKDTSGKDLDIVDENGEKYNIIPSEVKFTVLNGTVTATEAKASKDELGENGGVYADGTTFHVCDAIKPKTVVTINKKDVTGKEELEGATLTLTKADGSAIPGLTDNSWESKKDAAWNVQLQKGDYILKESGTKVTDENGCEYDVLNTEVAFTIGEDGNITVTSNNSKTDFDSDNSSETGFAVAKNVGTRDAELTICDAAKKTPVKFNKKDITGQEELAGATLTVYKYDGTKADK